MLNEDAEERYSLLPVEECSIHPLAKIRFEYQVDDLAESIAAVGQVQPGKAVQQASISGAEARYLVYIGCRRLLACKKAGVKQFKALVVTAADETKILTELLTENMKRANLSVLEELNLLANYSRHERSLEELAREIGISPTLMRKRVKIAVLLQDKGLVETFYKVEKLSGFRFTHRQIERITELEDAKWLPVAVQAAELSWKAEDIEALGARFSRESLIQTLPAWGRQFVASEVDQAVESPRTTKTYESPSTVRGTRTTLAASHDHAEIHFAEHSAIESHSRYQTMAESVQFLSCQRCGSETPIEFPVFPPATILKPSKIEKGTDVVALGKESVPLLLGIVSVKCADEKCGRTMIVVVDQSGDGQVLGDRRKLLSLVGSGIEPEDAGTGDLVWDGKSEVWLKVQSSGGRSTYLAYDERARKWVIPVKLDERAASLVT